jgi:hypothetical protein
MCVVCAYQGSVVVVEAGFQKGIPRWSGEKVLPNRVAIVIWLEV